MASVAWQVIPPALEVSYIVFTSTSSLAATRRCFRWVMKSALNSHSFAFVFSLRLTSAFAIILQPAFDCLTF